MYELYLKNICKIILIKNQQEKVKFSRVSKVPECITATRKSKNTQLA